MSTLVLEVAPPPTGPTAPVVEPPAPERPAWLPEKFKSPEDLAKSYEALEKKLGAQKAAEAMVEQAPEVTPEVDPAKAAEESPKTEEQKPADPQAAEAIVGPEAFAKYSEEFSKSGELSEESYKALADTHKLPKEVVDAYIQGQQVLAEKELNSYYELTGGQEGYQQMAEWARSNMDPKDVAAYDQLATSGDPASVRLALSGLYAKYQAANGSQTAPTIKGSASPTGAVSAEPGFNSTYEITQAMNDPRYRKDEAYRKLVERRIAKSSIL